ncbi:site-specific integrase [Flagellimonas allohymeniacidonis]|uniref:Site-specific integrase n=1 Tax=Flagellimonas allohymeniacidonis TaxID=2517819 RepID=A0A4Q8QEV0_9FLAO|nr:site-specific integrase [Allomuricauda hymeniacidonis]TAI48344.1 site-specific integrase [Allomuricauda hymeniacidonis]
MSSRATLSINFFPRKRKKDSEKSTIYCRITVNGERLEFSLQRKLQCHLWDNARKRGMGRSSLVKSLNSYLDQVYFGLLEAHRELLREGERVTPLAIKSRYMHTGENGKTLKDLIGYHNGTMHTSIKAGTRKNYYSTERCIDLFLKEEHKLRDIPLRELDYKFILDFEQYLRKYRPSTKSICNNNGAMKHMERLKKISRLGVRLGWLESDPFSNFKLRFERANSDFLTEEELERIEKKNFGLESIDRTKDIFMFACYTGLSYIDVKTLTENSLIRDMDGNYWLYLDRAKTGESLNIPLLPEAQDIIQKYNGANRGNKGLFPMQSNLKDELKPETDQ